LVHEILHHKYPEASERELLEKTNKEFQRITGGSVRDKLGLFNWVCWTEVAEK